MTQHTHDIAATIDAIRRAVARLERRVRAQRAIESATTGLTAMFLVLAVVLVLAKTGWLDEATLGWAVGLSALLPVLSAVWSWTRRLDAVELAQRLDRAHMLHDRLSTALFLAEQESLDSFELAQIRDAAGYVDNLDVAPASPFKRPTDLIPFGVVVGAVLFVGLLRAPDHSHPLPPAFVVEYDAVLDDATVALERDRLEKIRDALVAADDPDAEELVGEIDALLEKIENKEISEKEFLEELDRIEKKFFEKEGKDDHQELAAKLQEAAEALEKAAKKDLEKAPKEAKDLVEAFKKQDFEKAADAMEELARKMQQDEFSAKELERLAKLMEKFADLIDPNDPALEKLIKENEALIEQLSKLFDEGKLNKKEKERLKKAQEKKKNLNSKKKKSDDKPASRQLKELKRKTKEMANKAKQAASQKKKKGKKADPNAPDFKQEAGRHAKDAAEQLDKEKKEQQKSKARQMAKKQLEEMREAMRRQSRSKSDESSGEKKGEQMKEFLDRAKGKKPGEKGEEGKEGKEGEKGKDGKKNGGESKEGEKIDAPEGTGEQREPKNKKDGGKGDAQETDFAGKSEGDKKLGEETDLNAKRKDEKVTGAKNEKGASTSEIIKSASEEGFANTDYKDVYVDYESVVEEVMEKEKIPAGYRYYIKRYFQLIKPQDD